MSDHSFLTSIEHDAQAPHAPTQGSPGKSTLTSRLSPGLVLRVSDPTQPNPSPGPNGHPCNDLGLAYSSPWWLQP